jgi:hypothetical protein
MTVRRIIGFMTLAGLALGAGFWAGCQASKGSPGRVIWTSQTDSAGEYRTVDLEESPDPQKSQADLKERAKELLEEGWLIVAVSPPERQEDGTLKRRYMLKRAEKPGANNQPPPSKKTPNTKL